MAMNADDFQKFVASHHAPYSGVGAHSEAELAAIETTLGHPLPVSLKWLLSTHGYAEATGVDNLSMSVEHTLQCRQSIALPHNWLILNDWGDAGVVMLDLVSGRVCWCAAYDVERVAGHQTPIGQCYWYEGYPEWSKAQLEDAL